MIINHTIKPPCKSDCKDRCKGCKLTCIAYMFYQIGRNKEVEHTFNEKCGRDADSYLYDKYWRNKRKAMQKKR